MNKKSLLGLLLFASLVIAVLFFGATYLTGQSGMHKENGTTSYAKDNQSKGNITSSDTIDKTSKSSTENTLGNKSDSKGENTSDSFLISNTDNTLGNSPESIVQVSPTPAEEVSGAIASSIQVYDVPNLILDSTKVDYQSYIPEMVYDVELETALDINNPDISVDAKAAILFDANTKKVLYYKDAVQPRFSASTIKLLTSLVALTYCTEEEQVTIGEEIKMMASDSTRASLRPGQILTIRNLLEGMLLPSGNDAAYAVAAYVGRKSLVNPRATREEAIVEFIRLMNEEAASLGVKNSCFKTPDGYDAIGQYTTAYDMGLIGIAAANKSTIIEVAQESSARNIFVSGEDVTWDNTNKLIRQNSGQYYSNAIGLKTGTSTMAGRCIIAAAEKDGKKVVCVILDSTQAGRWEDSIKLLKYGLN